MNSQPLPTLSAKVTSEKRTNNILLVTLVILLGVSLAGIIAVITTAHIRTGANSIGDTTQLSSNTVANAPSVSIKWSGRDYGAIYGAVDPGANLAADPAAAMPALGPGRDFGAIYGAVDPGAKLTADPAAAMPAHGPGRNFGAIYGTVDPGLILSADPPSIIYWVNGQMVPRRSELGPLTDPVSNPLANPVVNSPLVLGPGRDYGAIYGAIDPGKNLCAQQPKLSYTFNGITVVRRSELGPLTETVDKCSPANVP